MIKTINSAQKINYSRLHSSRQYLGKLLKMTQSDSYYHQHLELSTQKVI